MQERTETQILSKSETLSPSRNILPPENDSKENKTVKRYHRILIVNETIETYLEGSSDDSDSNELSIDKSMNRDVTLMSGNNTTQSSYCNTPELNIISSEDDESIVVSNEQKTDDDFKKIFSNKWQTDEKPVVEKSTKLKHEENSNFNSEVLDVKPDIDTCEITIVNESIKDECSNAVDYKNETPSPTVLNSLQDNVKIFEQRFRKIAPKEMPINSNVDKEIWRINPPKKTIKKKKKKVLIKFRRKRIKKRKIRHRIEQIHAPAVEDLAMEIEEYIVPDEPIEVAMPQLESGLNLIQCPYCSYKNPKESGVKKHLLMFHGGFTNCPHCNFQTLSWKTMERHFVKHFADGIHFTCPFCQQVFTKVVLMKSHLFTVHRNSDPSECFLCGFKAPTPGKFINVMRSLRQHVLDEHSNKTEIRYNCPLCKFKTTLDLEMKSHIYLSHEKLKGNFYQCSDCPYITITLNELIHHLDIHRDGVRLTCSLCKFVGLNNLRMTLHRNTHREKPYKCAYCDAKFNHHFLVKYHIQYRHNKKKGIPQFSTIKLEPFFGDVN